MKKRIWVLIIAFTMLISAFPSTYASADYKIINLPQADVKIGDYLKMGTYYGDPILWRCIDIDENGPLMLSDKIICFKEFDAPGDNTNGSHGRQHKPINGINRTNSGSNYWKDSNMRSWLNSDASAGKVKWLCGNPPDDEHCYGNPYSDEAGFKTNFTSDELKAVKKVSQDSIISSIEYDNMQSYGSTYHVYKKDISEIVQNAKTTAYRETVEDEFFLLDVNQVYSMYSNSGILGDKYYVGIATRKAVLKSSSNLNTVEGVPNITWLRTPYAGEDYGYENQNQVATDTLVISVDGTVGVYPAWYSYVGVRPAFYLDQSHQSITGIGTSSSPYTIGGMLDSDGDGLYDEWERNGIDTDGDGEPDLRIDLMGANPDVPDIFVEVDWMVQPEKKIGFITTQNKQSLAPSENAMRMVYNAFKKYGVYKKDGKKYKGINLHIDCGPNSTDFVTGRKWGNLSGANEIPYEEDFDTSNWITVTKNNFKRPEAFHHAIFINKFNSCSNSGATAGGDGRQYFLIANQDWLREKGDLAIAGTFMHELGHSLGLDHGGGDSDNYKPNYLSIMNYSFQMTGLYGTNELNYSSYLLPDLDEEHLNEHDGVDPQGLTDGTGLSTKWPRWKEKDWQQIYRKVVLGNKHTFSSVDGDVAFSEIDFNNNRKFESDVSVDLNKDGNKRKLKGYNDWDNLIYKSGAIGGYGIDFTQNMKDDIDYIEEADLNELIENGVFANEGEGYIEGIGPYTIINGEPEQNVYVRVSNLYNEESSFELTVDKSKISDGFSKTVTVDASTKDISYIDVPIPINNNIKDGKYIINAKLSYPGMDDITAEIPVEVYSPTKDELTEAAEKIDNADELPEIVKNEYKRVLPSAEGKTSSDTKTAVSGTGIKNTSKYKDLDESDNCFDEVNILSELGIIDGYDDGTFKPWDNVTRAEFTKLVITGIGRQDYISSSMRYAKFTDVPKSHWAYDYINDGVYTGMIEGYSDDYFGPEDSITYMQAMKILTAAIGYKGLAEKAGGWPDGYKKYGDQCGIGKGVYATRDEIITRGEIAIMLYNALNAPVISGMDEMMDGYGDKWQTNFIWTIDYSKYPVYPVNGYKNGDNFIITYARNFSDEYYPEDSNYSVELLSSNYGSDIDGIQSKAFLQYDWDEFGWNLIYMMNE